MNLKNVIVSGLTGSIVYFLLGWVFYGMLFTDIYPAGMEQNLSFIYLGSLVYAIMIAIIFDWSGVTNAGGGAKSGAIIGFMYTLAMNLFMFSSQPFDMYRFAMDILVSTIMTSLMGTDIGVVLGKMGSKRLQDN